jgi:pyruvate formate lyase activating enzyme
MADMVLFDIKHADPAIHARLTGKSNSLIIKNLRALERAGAPVEIRVPVIPGLNDGGDNFVRIAKLLAPMDNVRSIVLLGYHKLGLSKIYDFDKHGADIGAIPPRRDDLEQLADDMRKKSGKPTTFR